MENSIFTSQLDILFSIWNNAIHLMNFWVHAMGTYRATAILVKVQTAFLNCNYFCKLTNMSDEIVLAMIMTALDLEFARALHYHDECYDIDNDYDLPGPFTIPVYIYLVSMTRASLNPVD